MTCSHSRWQSERQFCACCRTQDHFDFRVSDAAWNATIPDHLRHSPVCLRCFDAFAAERGVNYAGELSRLDFVGDRGSFTFRPESALDADEWAAQRVSGESRLSP